MSATQHEFADSESASFLYGEDANKDQDRKLRPVKGWWSRIARYVPYVLLALGILLALLIVASPKTVGETSTLPSQSMFSKDFSLLISETVPQKLVVFNPDNSYDVDPFGPDELDTPWNKLPPPGKGHIKVTDPAKLGLTGGFPLKDPDYPDTEEYTVALFHQLHCLAAIKSKMSRLQDWYKGENDKEYLTFALGEDQVAGKHIYHCFDYLRQALLCHGDTTLEKARVVEGPNGASQTVRGVDGWGVTHQCRDYDSIYALANAHRSRNDTGIA